MDDPADRSSAPERLLIIEKDSGLTLFDHKWVETEVDEDFFGGVLQGLLHISIEAFHKGAIKEIQFDEGVLLIHHGNQILAGLLASRACKELRVALARFGQEFEASYYAEAELPQNEISQYRPAQGLVAEFFPDNVA